MEQTKKEKPRVPALQILPSDRFPFTVHSDVVKRFVNLSHNGTQALDARRVEGEGVPSQASQLNVRFLKSIGLLTTTDRGLYMPTSEAIRFVSARTVSDDKARPILRTIIEPSWFVATARSLLSPAKRMKEDEFLGELAIAAQTDKEKKEMALRVLLEYLVYSGIVIRGEEGLLLAGSEIANLPKSEGLEKPLNISAARFPGESNHGREEADPMWHTIQTEDFILKIRSDVHALDDLLDHLQTLRRKIERVQSRRQVTNDEKQPT